MKYLKKEENKLIKLKILKEWQKMLKHQVKFHQLSYETNWLYFVETTKVKNICLIEKKIDQFFKTIYKNYDYFASILTLNYLIKRTYWSIRVKNVEAWCQNYHVCQARFRRFIKNETFII